MSFLFLRNLFYLIQNEDGYWGYINSRGEWVIPAQFESASDIKNGVGFVDTGERCGLIKLSG